MNATVAGLMTGLALGFAGYFGGFGAFIVVAVVGLAGLIVGWLAHDGRVINHLRRRDSRQSGQPVEPSRNGEGRRSAPRPPRSAPAATSPTHVAAPRPEQRTRVR